MTLAMHDLELIADQANHGLQEAGALTIIDFIVRHGIEVEAAIQSDLGRYTVAEVCFQNLVGSAEFNEDGLAEIVVKIGGVSASVKPITYAGGVLEYELSIRIGEAKAGLWGRRMRMPAWEAAMSVPAPETHAEADAKWQGCLRAKKEWLAHLEERLEESNGTDLASGSTLTLASNVG